MAKTHKPIAPWRVESSRVALKDRWIDVRADDDVIICAPVTLDDRAAWPKRS